MEMPLEVIPIPQLTRTKKMINIQALRKQEEFLCLELSKIISDKKGCNFVKPLSEFWKGCPDDPMYNTYGLWISGDGGTLMKDGSYAVDYNVNNQVHPDIKAFMKFYDLDLEWYDPGTAMLLIRI